MKKQLLLWAATFIWAAFTQISATAGGVFLTGHDPDYHGFAGGNAIGAQHIIQRAIAYVTSSNPAPTILLVTDVRNPGGDQSDSRLGMIAAGFPTFDVADYGSGTPGVLDLHTVNFNNYDAVVVASDYGGWLRQDELDILNARSADILNFINGGNRGLVAFAEAGNRAGGPPIYNGTTHDRFGYLPFIVSQLSLNQGESGFTVTQAGLDMGLTPADINGNASHNVFTGTGGLDIIDQDPNQNILSLATRKSISAAGVCTNNISVSVYSGHSSSGGGAPYSGLVGTFKSSTVSFATDTGYSWHPFGLGDFGADITGYLNVGAAGVYSFTLNSDDGSLLYIDGNLVVDDSGVHSPNTASGSTALVAGQHSFEIQFFECCGGPSGVDLGLPNGVVYGCPPTNRPPVAKCKNVVVAAGPNCQASASIDDGSSDPDSGDTITVTQSPAGPYPLGTTVVTLTVTDNHGASDTCTATVTVVDNTPPSLNCPQDIVACNDPGQCSAVVNYQASASDSCPGVTLVCTPPSGSVFPKGSTPVTCAAIDGSGNANSCTFHVTVNDCESPLVACRPGPNPSGKKIPTAGKNPSSGQNPDGFYQLLAKDNCDASPAIFVADSCSSFIAGPFKSGDVVKLTQSGKAFADIPGPQGIAAHIHTKCDPLLIGVDASGNVSVGQSCLVPPPPK